MAISGVCAVAECSKTPTKRGLCNAHYLRLIRHGSPTASRPRKTRQPCAAEGCDKMSRNYGYCPSHAHRFRRHADPFAGRTLRAEPARWIAAHVSHTDDACLVWPFGRNNGGRGLVRHKRENLAAHRLMCEAVHGPAPAGMEVAHNCGKGHLGCVNPLHLRWATKVENMADKLIHGTDNRGSKHPRVKLTEAQVGEIRQVQGRETLATTAGRYGVSPATIHSIYRRRSWAWLD